MMADCRFHTLIIDLDGTLLATGGGVSARNVRAIESARQAGLRVIIATGRAMVECLEPLQDIGHEGLLIGAGGSVMQAVPSGETLQRRVMPHDVVVEAADVLLGHGHKVLLLKDASATGYDYLALGPGELDPASRWWFEHLPVRVRFADHHEDDPHPHDTLRTAIVATSGEVTPIAEDLRQRLAERAALQHWSAVTSSEAVGSVTHLLEVFNPMVNKWTMVERYLAEHELGAQGVVAIGDGLNDVELIAHAGLGIAMANADPRVKAVADQMTGDHNDSGVAEAIDRLLRGS